MSGRAWFWAILLGSICWSVIIAFIIGFDLLAWRLVVWAGWAP